MGGANIFFHIMGAGNNAHAQALIKGQPVSFARADNKKGPCAEHIRVRALFE